MTVRTDGGQGGGEPEEYAKQSLRRNDGDLATRV
jgi:hypothetical protein